MKHSADRILTTHVGSLPRPADLYAMSVARREGQKIDTAAFDARVRKAVSDIVRKQAELGIDIVDDGEMSKPSFITYINERLAGFEVDSAAPTRKPMGRFARGQADFPEILRPATGQRACTEARPGYLCTAPVKSSRRRRRCEDRSRQSEGSVERRRRH